MKTIRSSVFETNSSSCHCIVVANADDYKKFVDGELFADEKAYKCSCRSDLISFDEVYSRYLAHLDNMNSGCGDSKELPLGMNAVYWLMLHPEMFELDDDKRIELINGSNDIKDSVREELLTEMAKPGYTRVNSFMCWIDYDSAPASYEMLRYWTEDFTSEYDGYGSSPVVDVVENGMPMKELRCVWYV